MLRNLETLGFALHLTRLGFKVYIAESEDYGFITDNKGQRVLSFNLGTFPSLGGKYGPPSSTCGDGWRLEGLLPTDLATAEDVKEALYAYPPPECKGWKHFTSARDYLDKWDPSSRFTLFTS